MIKKENIGQFELDNIFNSVLDVTHSFYRFSDSKFVGLAIFLIANLFTGFVNIAINTHDCSLIVTFLILTLNLFVSSFIPFFYFYYKNKI